MASSWTRFLLQTCCCIFALPFLLHAQQSPTYRTPIMDFNESHRQSVCDRQAQLHNGTLELRNALSGMQLRPLLLTGNIATLLLPTETIPEKNPGITVEMMDELAKRAGFSWRNSFGIANASALPPGTTFDDILQWSTRTYDMSASLWTHSIQRVNFGIAFPEGFVDSSVILVGEKTSSDSKLNVWSFLEPFTAGVWIMIAVTLVISGVIYWWMEWYNEESDRQDFGKKPTEPLFFAGLSFTGEILFQPSTDYARVFVLSLAFFCLLIGSAYTANLASFLVVQNAPSLRVDGVEEAVSLGLSMCVWQGTSQAAAVSQRHPGARLVQIDTGEDDVFLGITNGQCDLAITSVGSWNRYQGNSLVNGDCSLDWVGRVFRFLNGGFATLSDSGTLCTNLIRDTLTLHLLEMKEDGFIEDAWDREVESSWDINCEVQTTSQGDDADSSQLGLQDTGGLFIVHYGVTLVAVIMAVITKRKGFRKLCQLTAIGKKDAINGKRASQDTSDGSNCVHTPKEQWELEAMHLKQSEELATLSQEMTSMLTRLQHAQKQSERMGEMMQTSNA